MFIHVHVLMCEHIQFNMSFSNVTYMYICVFHLLQLG